MPRGEKSGRNYSISAGSAPYTAAPMDAIGWWVFLASVAVGSYVQAVTGFAMGMIVIAVVGAGSFIPLPTLTAVASLLSLVNVALALKGHLGALHRPIFLWLAVGQIPAIGVGVWLLDVLDRDLAWLLELLLGLFITFGCLSMMLRPVPRPRVSSRLACVGAGIAGGVIGGLFSASGPVIGWFNYRQPLELRVIRATLLATFALTTSTRTVVVGFGGGLTAEVGWYAAAAVPLVAAGTWLGRGLPPAVGEQTLKRMAFGLLLAMGLWITAGAIPKANGWLG